MPLAAKVATSPGAVSKVTGTEPDANGSAAEFRGLSWLSALPSYWVEATLNTFANLDGGARRRALSSAMAVE